MPIYARETYVLYVQHKLRTWLGSHLNDSGSLLFLCLRCIKLVHFGKPVFTLDVIFLRCDDSCGNPFTSVAYLLYRAFTNKPKRNCHFPASCWNFSTNCQELQYFPIRVEYHSIKTTKSTHFLIRGADENVTL